MYEMFISDIDRATYVYQSLITMITTDGFDLGYTDIADISMCKSDKLASSSSSFLRSSKLASVSIVFSLSEQNQIHGQNPAAI